MKQLIAVMLILFLSNTVFSQTVDDYENTLQLVRTAYNKKDPSLIYQKFSSSLKKELEEDAFNKMIQNLNKDKGKMLGHELILEEETGKNFLVDFENGSMLLMIHLSSDNQISTFNIKEY